MNRQKIFEAHYAGQHDLPVETLAQYRWLHQDGYRLPGIAAAYRNFCAGWDAQKTSMVLGRFTAEVFYQPGDDPFICSVIGMVTTECLSAAQGDLVDNPPDELSRGAGTYTFDFFFEPGQFDEMGRCEFSPGWGFDFVSFENLEEEVKP